MFRCGSGFSVLEGTYTLLVQSPVRAARGISMLRNRWVLDAADRIGDDLKDRGVEQLRHRGDFRTLHRVLLEEAVAFLRKLRDALEQE